MVKDIGEKVYDFLTKIPPGKVVTYGQISSLLEINSARAVGQILHRNENPEIYPCHRVVFADGSLSDAFAFGGKLEHKNRLQAEGVKFKNGKVNMKLHQYFIQFK